MTTVNVIYESQSAKVIEVVSAGPQGPKGDPAQTVSAPPTGTFPIGKAFFNSNAAPGGYAGWINTTAGWRPFGLIAA